MPLMSSQARLEIACFNPQSAFTAAQAGADRIELCANRDVGGTTPTVEDFDTTHDLIKNFRVPIYVMIRPRGGDFTYTRSELDEMITAIQSFPHADGFVFGVLDSRPNSIEIDTRACIELLSAASPRPCTFHRAFDGIPPHLMASKLENLISLGFSSVLTSGCIGDASEGGDVLKNLTLIARGRIDLIIGGGVRSSNLQVLRQFDAPWYHSSAVIHGGAFADAQEVQTLSLMLKTH
ncbi:copper homeostasis protein CutC [Bisporella sp. PMI_857]|nr:copper homeostasis protein CutC [Bisporella sp. PMI_857]